MLPASPDSCALQDFLPLEADAAHFERAIAGLEANLTWFSGARQQSSMHNAELLLVGAYIRLLQPDVLFESGVYHGRSSAVLARLMADYAPRGTFVTACYPAVPPNVRELPSAFPRFRPVAGGGEAVVRTLDRQANVLAVIDGPKPAPQSRSTSERAAVYRGGKGAPLSPEVRAWASLMDSLRGDFRNASVIFLHDIRRQWRPDELEGLMEYYMGSRMFETHKLCFMSEDVIRRWSARLDLGGDPTLAGKAPADYPKGHPTRLLTHNGWSNMAFLVKDGFHRGHGRAGSSAARASPRQAPGRAGAWAQEARPGSAFARSSADGGAGPSGGEEEAARRRGKDG